MTTEKILAILTAVFGGGWLTQFLYLRHEKRKKAVELQGIEIDIDEKEDRLRDKKLSDAYDQLLNMQKIIDSERNKWVELAERASRLQMELLQEKEARLLAEYNKCVVTGCDQRTPPRKTKQDDTARI